MIKDTDSPLVVSINEDVAYSLLLYFNGKKNNYEKRYGYKDRI